MKLNHSSYIGKKIVWLFIVSFLLNSCKKMVDVDPPVTSTSGESVFQEDITAIATITALYVKLSSISVNTETGLPAISKKAGLSADELTLWSGADNFDVLYYKNSLTVKNQVSGITAGFELWQTCYSYINTCNAALQGLNSSTTLTPSVKKQLLGEAKFMRAFLYFYLVNLYGDAPLVTSTDYQVNRSLPRATKDIVYELIISDLKDAQTLLSTTYLNGQLKNYTGTQERVRPTLWTATALLARVFLYTNDYTNAENEAAKIINNTSLFNLTSLNNTFLKNSAEAIWQLQPVNKNGSNFWNSEDARLFLLTASPAGLNSDHPVFLSQSLLNSFETGDNRLTNWVGMYTDGTGTYKFPNKYKIGTATSTITEYMTVLRLAEQYLVRAEARTQLGNFSGAQTDLNMIRVRAGLPNTTANDKGALLAAILHERQVELFTEWGHRWLDLKRTGNVDLVMNVITPLKANGAVWKSNQQWYPLPLEDIQRNSNLAQNAGY